MSRCAASRWRRALTRQIPGLAVHVRRTLLEAGRAQRQEHAFAHFLRGAARESERQNALRRIDQGQQPQIALHQQRRLARNRREPAPAPNPAPGWRARGPHGPTRRSVMISAPSSSAAGTRHSPCSQQVLQACTVGATAARPAAKSAARFARCGPTTLQSESARLPMPSSVDSRPHGLNTRSAVGFGDKAALRGVHLAVGDRDQRLRTQQRVDGQLRIVRPLAAPIGGGACRSCSRSRRATRPPAGPLDRSAPGTRDPRDAPPRCPAPVAPPRRVRAAVRSPAISRARRACARAPAAASAHPDRGGGTLWRARA